MDTVKNKKIRIAMFDAKSIDIDFFNTANSDGKFEISFFKEKLSEKSAKLAANNDAVCVFTNDNIDKNVVNELSKIGIKMIALRCAGYNNIDLKATMAKHICVANVPNYSPYAVAEHAMALLLASARHIDKSCNNTREYNFALDGLAGFELHKKTIGIIGTGKIGKKFIKICRGFGANVIAYDTFQSTKEHINYVEKDELFRQSDIISLHCPLTSMTKHIINKTAISKMKKGVVIINTSRGGLIDSEALLEGLSSGKIAAAGLDVYENESEIFFRDLSDKKFTDKTLKSLLAMPNVIMTPHQAFLTNEALSSIAATTLENIEEYIKTGETKNRIQII